MKASELYAGNYLTAAELPPGKHQARIFDVNVETVGQGADQGPKLVLSLTSPNGRAWPKTLVVNKTNMLVLSGAYGDETDEWPGKAIIIWSDPGVMYAGKRVGGIRLDVPPQAGNGAAASPVVPPRAASQPPGGPGPHWAGPGSDLDDDIPFA